MKAKDILSEIKYELLFGSLDKEISGAALDSRKAGNEMAFIAMIGQKDDGHKYIVKAAENGSPLILIDERKKDCLASELKAIEELGSTVVSVSDTRKAYADMACTYFSHPSKDMQIIGLTGTKGKTTSTYIIHEILNRAGRSCGLIGTVENKICGKAFKSKHTTPEAWEFQQFLSEMKEEGVKSCVMEVSSLGLKFSRTHGVNFEIGVFTNFLNDHISDGEHETEEDYFISKLRLFDHCRIALVNKNTRRFDEVAAYAGSHTEKCYTYSVSGEADFYVKELSPATKDGVPGMRFLFVCPDYETEFFVPLLCDFNVDNALCAAACAHLAGVSKEQIENGMLFVKVPGRMEKIDNKLDLKVFVDYAHNGDSLKVLLQAIRPSCKGRIITVFGCGGDRPHDRRYTMGEVSGRYSDFTVVTTDNSRSEEFSRIAGMIVEGIERVPGAPYEIIEDRKKAIAHAVDMAHPDDIVVIAGKGHETTMTIKDSVVEFIDSVVASEVLRALEKERGV
ncbi:MAG: UDP-N-acetylmuramoyl-L-alanyl-D-glutamate--2,6-diaminopimelate ligase [Clostridiales bacterium]|nr:UDP-N-acetylmuramoyl-L-alanyl-D-glutamate--2,6-diaminopimelate ligase [Clostridiales bacterium]